ncbi:malate dehydrogenase [Neorickettsia sennetsu]|uniref:Malate dehydrogenase n=1 Tax=Ehrlichia sennetsu (strain ATCC VR-367 / Miyayama) TaxID=222891 RepID=MDH_EHRS3|nr:malate dehydrogenase [Neorickettsia sennetsu]Q2GCH6.1 RecName: Full=Malate dehydrogenase [Neorickettsia sennetsu str. Miyayama]ABD46433.1 malate dehydrogenase, NAD-dependent [Neorickettsia sennetsu str. Miyayama]
MKVSLIGAGNIGGTLAYLIASKKLASEVELIDVNGDLARGKALDVSQTLPLIGYTMKINGSANMERIKGSSVIIITAGIPRKPGMTREELIDVNAVVMKEVGEKIKKFAPKAFVIVVTNPLDVMVWVLYKAAEISPDKIVGMAGVLDASRMNLFLAQELGVSVADVKSLVLGSHGDSMVPLFRHSTVSGMSLPELVSVGLITKDKVDSIIERTRSGGAEIVALLKTGSAYYTPAASVLEMAEAYLLDQKKTLVCSVMMRGRYGVEDDIFSGIPVIMGSGGVERVIELDLTPDERRMFENSVAATRKLVLEARKYF